MLGTVVALVVAALHVGFLVLEMFLWTTPTGMKIFRRTPAQAADSKTLAMNQGLYNGFLAAGIGWGTLRADVGVVEFFCGCVVVAGLFGAATVSSRILVVQALPALVALGLLFAGM